MDSSDGGVRMTAYKTETYQPWATPAAVTTTTTRVTDVNITSTDVDNRKLSMHSSNERPYRIVSKLFAEFLGTLIFVYIGSMSGVKAGPTGLIHAAFAHGFTIFVLVTSLGHISGGHFNPAVTWAVAVAGKLSPVLVPAYWIVQLFGGFIGSLLVRASLKKAEFISIDAGATLLAGDDDWYQGLIVEAMLTLILTQTVLMSAVDTNEQPLAPLAIGFTVALDIFGAGSISGASMNPARSLGPSLAGTIFFDSNTSHFWDFHYIYWAGPLIGATISAIHYKLLFSRSSRIIP